MEGLQMDYDKSWAWLSLGKVTTKTVPWVFSERAKILPPQSLTMP
jgi:hypothetical protein